MLSEQISNLHSKIRDIEFSYDNLIVGSNLNSLIFCYKSGYPIIFDHIEKPLFFDKIPDNVCLKEFGIKKEINQLGSSAISRFGLIRTMKPANAAAEKI